MRNLLTFMQNNICISLRRYGSPPVVGLLTSFPFLHANHLSVAIGPGNEPMMSWISAVSRRWAGVSVLALTIAFASALVMQEPAHAGSGKPTRDEVEALTRKAAAIVETQGVEAAREIFSKYLTPTLPLHPEDLAEFDHDPHSCVQAMIDRTVCRMYEESEENQFLEVTYAGGDKEVLYFKDFNSGAMIQNIVDRAKKMAIKDFLDHDQHGLRVSHLLQACVDEFKENEDLPNTTNPDDWARISGKKGERIVFIRTLITGKSGTEPGRSIDTVANTGQYL